MLYEHYFERYVMNIIFDFYLFVYFLNVLIWIYFHEKMWIIVCVLYTLCVFIVNCFNRSYITFNHPETDWKQNVL